MLASDSDIRPGKTQVNVRPSKDQASNMVISAEAQGYMDWGRVDENMTCRQVAVLHAAEHLGQPLKRPAAQRQRILQDRQQSLLEIAECLICIRVAATENRSRRIGSRWMTCQSGSIIIHRSGDSIAFALAATLRTRQSASLHRRPLRSIVGQDADGVFVQDIAEHRQRPGTAAAADGTIATVAAGAEVLVFAERDQQRRVLPEAAEVVILFDKIAGRGLEEPAGLDVALEADEPKPFASHTPCAFGDKPPRLGLLANPGKRGAARNADVDFLF
jgi:hypothetical protein